MVICNQLVAVLDELPSYQENIEEKLAMARAPSDTALSWATDNIRNLAQELSGARRPGRR